jgi:hypothetical protein
MSAAISDKYAINIQKYGGISFSKNKPTILVSNGLSAEYF